MARIQPPFLILLLLLLQNQSPTAQAQEGDHWPGNQCTTSMECGLDTRMVCDQNQKLCVCTLIDGFDYKEKACFLTVGTSCNGAEPFKELTPHSHCNITAGKIECDSTYPKTFNNKCGRPLDGQCSVDKDCDRDLFLTCDLSNNSGPGLCKCPPGANFKDGKCILNSQSECQVEASAGPPVIKCPSNLKCILDPRDNSTAKTEVCTCDKNFFENSNGVCAAGWDGYCMVGSFEYPCDDTAYLFCDEENFINPRCRCIDPENTYHDEVDKICKTRAGKECVKGQGQGQGRGQQPCASFSDCEDVGGVSHCVCDTGLTENDGRCYSQFDDECSRENERLPPCKDYAYLECGQESKRCECYAKDLASFNATRGICERLPGSKCGGPYSQPCAEISECNNSTYFCECKGDLILLNQKCFVAYGGECESPGSGSGAGKIEPWQPNCNEPGFVTCQGGKCSCEEYPNIWYQNSTKSCVLLEGSPCPKDKAEKVQMTCANYSNCTENESSGNFECRCIEDHTASKKRTCVGLLGADCGLANTADCNKEDFLKCDERHHTCSCEDYWSQGWYDPISKECELLAGDYCTNGTEEQKCRDFSVCKLKDNGETRCNCLDDLYHTVEHDCVVPYGGKCGTADRPLCHESNFQTCDEAMRICACAGDKQSVWYDPSLLYCVLEPGQQCLKSYDMSTQPCGHFSTCTPDDDGDDINGTCLCLDYLVYYEGQCYAQHGMGCSGTHAPCLPGKFMTCLQPFGECICAGDNAWYNNKTEICELLPGAQCTIGANAQSCTEFSHCSALNGKTGVCACAEGLIVSKEGQCVFPYGEVCSVSDGSPPCNTAAFEFCGALGVCACANSSNVWYEPFTKSCALLTGASCIYNNQYAQPCVQYASCKEKTEWKGDFQCACVNGVEDPKNRQCVTTYGNYCGEADSSICNPDEFLGCVSGKCRCGGGDDVVYDEISKSCKLLPGSQCFTQENSQECAQFSNCSEVTSWYGQCTCADGLTETLSKDCVIPNGASCQNNNQNPESSPHCNLDGHQFCNDDGICACASPELVLSKDETCIRPFDTPCDEPGLVGGCDFYRHQDCIQHKCACADPDVMAYKEEDVTCYLTIDSPCKGSNVTCDTQLTCAEPSGTCQCNRNLGLSPDGNGACALTLGQSCHATEDIDPSIVMCNAYEYLVCHEERCECDLSGYTQQNDNCIGNWKAPCRSHANCNGDYSLVCRSDNVTSMSSCNCSAAEGQVYDSALTGCYSAVGGDCHIKELSGNWTGSGIVPLRCNPHNNLICSNGTNTNADTNIGTCVCQNGNCDGPPSSSNFVHLDLKNAAFITAVFASIQILQHILV